MDIIDGHIHIFSRIDGANAMGPVRGCGLGRTENAGVISPFMPPLCEGTCFNAAMLMETLSQNGVSGAVLMQNPTIGSCNEEIGSALLAHPGVLAGAMQVDPFRPGAADLAAGLAGKYPFSALKLEVSTGWGWTGIHHASDFSYKMLCPLIELAGEHSLAVVFDTGDTDSYAYLPGEISALARSYPHVTFVIEHGGYLTPGGDISKWDDMISAALADNVFMGICAMGILLDDPYPCAAANEYLRRIYSRLGAAKLIWGTDAPCTLKKYTYAQMVDSVAVHARFISDADRELIMAENARRIYFS